MTLQAALRADASLGLGTGHLRRCQALAAALASAGAEVPWACRGLDKVAAHVLCDTPDAVHWLPAPEAASRLRRLRAVCLTRRSAWSRGGLTTDRHCPLSLRRCWYSMPHLVFR